MILQSHVLFYEEILSIPHFLESPALLFGVQDIEENVKIKGSHADDLIKLLEKWGIEAYSLDLFDSRASFRHDMNLPLDDNMHGRFRTLIDIGSLEHVFDTKQCIENALRLVKLGGHYLVHTPVNGYYAHGFHVFNPGALVGALEMNGFRILYQKYSREDGVPVQDPAEGGDILMWLVGVKESEVADFKCPQQDGWSLVYHPSPPPPSRSKLQILPKTKVKIRLFLPHGYPIGQYTCALLTEEKQEITSTTSAALLLEGIRILTVTFDLSKLHTGKYFIAIRSDILEWNFYHVQIVDEFAVSWLKL
jgi:hypothetical protein